MKQNKLFTQSRWRLTQWYAGSLTFILSIIGIGVYEAIDHAHNITITQELDTVASTIHDSLQPILKKPEQLNDRVTNFLPDLCFVDRDCLTSVKQNNQLSQTLQQGEYYLQFFDLSSELIALAGIQPQGLSLQYDQQRWQKLTDENNIRYRQISLELHTASGEKWGYLHVGKSLADFDRYVSNVRWLLLFGLPIMILLVIIASWYLAKQAIQPIYHSYRQIQQFSADVAHELRTPLAVTQATIESSLLSNGLTLNQIKDTLTTVQRQNQRLSLLVADLLTLSHMEKGVHSPNKLRINTIVILNDVVADVTEELSSLAYQKNLLLQTHISTDKQIQILANEQQIYRLLMNLVNNAIQYTSEGNITVSLSHQQKNAIIKVSDTGEGIDHEQQKLIFDRFYRVNKARSRNRGGSGLGLAIAKTIVSNHQGKIKVESRLGQGSIFTVYLPSKATIEV